VAAAPTLPRAEQKSGSQLGNSYWAGSLSGRPLKYLKLVSELLQFLFHGAKF
jgi:hypothetical protein